MSKIEEVAEEWKEDSKIDETQLPRELIRIPQLHSKYLNYFMFFKAKFAATEKKHNAMMWVKRKYFRGEFGVEDLKKYGWSQWNGLKPNMGELNQLLEMDRDMNDLKEQLSGYKTAVGICEYILKEINNRGYLLRTLVDYEKFQAGA